MGKSTINGGPEPTMVDPLCSSPASTAWIFGDASASGPRWAMKSGVGEGASCGNLRPWTKEAEAKSIVSIVSVENGIRNLKNKKLASPFSAFGDTVELGAQGTLNSSSIGRASNILSSAFSAVFSSSTAHARPNWLANLWQVKSFYAIDPVKMIYYHVNMYTYIYTHLYLYNYICLSIPSTVSAGPSRRNWSYAPTTLPQSLCTLSINIIWPAQQFNLQLQSTKFTTQITCVCLNTYPLVIHH